MMVSLDVNNLLDLKAIARVNSRTNDPLDDGVNFYRKITQFSPQSYYEKADFVRPNTWSSTQYDAYGDRYYSKYSDLDLNGQVTQEEQFTQFKKYLSDVVSFKGNFQAPRTVNFGIMFNF